MKRKNNILGITILRHLVQFFLMINLTEGYENYYGTELISSSHLWGAPPKLISPPENLTKVIYDTATFFCKWDGGYIPFDAHVEWYRNGMPTLEIPLLGPRIELMSEGSLTINKVDIGDSGFYECRMRNVYGSYQAAAAYLNVEYPARVGNWETKQYLPLGRSGLIRCHILSNPPVVNVKWTRNSHSLEHLERDGYQLMTNGSLLIEQVKATHEGNYTCEPFNLLGSEETSLPIQVLVKEPPKFNITPDSIYEREFQSTLEIPCSAQKLKDGTIPVISWRRRDKGSLSPYRAGVAEEGSLFIRDINPDDSGEYECVASNEAGTIVSSTRIIVTGAYPFSRMHSTANVIRRSYLNSAVLIFLVKL